MAISIYRTFRFSAYLPGIRLTRSHRALLSAVGTWHYMQVDPHISCVQQAALLKFGNVKLSSGFPHSSAEIWPFTSCCQSVLLLLWRQLLSPLDGNVPSSWWVLSFLSSRLKFLSCLSLPWFCISSPVACAVNIQLVLSASAASDSLVSV